ncbi:U-box domain-containing protein 9-like [Dorcoceras hygrometricum]|uniref:U-box domain-containing protein 9-like n=1 Tax=Dorcoceras hygrometricum TaxID=472368 RepID=A0A2Z7B6Z0_9LAMI|nr:U-box domain-containing protein 9-like [Dorcoceras hygrometricum]
MLYSKLQSRNDTVPTKRNDAATFYQQATISLAKNQMLVVEFPSKPISSWLRKITQNDDASTNLYDAVLDMPHRYQLLRGLTLSCARGLTDVGEHIVQKSEETVSQCDISAAYFVEEPIEETKKNPGTEISDVVQTTDEESMSLDELLATIPHGSMLPSTIGEITKIKFGRSITIRGVNEGELYKECLPKIPVADKGKAPLHERDPIKGHPAREIFYLICADIELLIQLQEKIIDDFEQFFNSFSLHRLAALKSDEDIYAKEEQVLIWAETDSTRVALMRRMYILTKYRELLFRKFLEARLSNFIFGQSFSAIDLKVLDMLSNLHMLVLEELKTQMREHGLQWELTCCSRLFEGAKRDRGVVIARSNTNTKSSCWIRTRRTQTGSLKVPSSWSKPLSTQRLRCHRRLGGRRSRWHMIHTLSCRLLHSSLSNCKAFHKIWRVEKYWLVISALALVDGKSALVVKSGYRYPGFSASRRDGSSGGAPGGG